MKRGLKIRCTYSPLFSKEMERSKYANKERWGFVVKESRDEICWYVLWDDIKTPLSVHKDYIILLPNEPEVGNIKNYQP